MCVCVCMRACVCVHVCVYVYTAKFSEPSVMKKIYLSPSHFREELDGSAARRTDKFPAPFQVIVEVEVNRSDRSGGDEGRTVSWQNLPHPRASPLTCFSSHVEEEEVLKQFGKWAGGWTGRRLADGQVGRYISTQAGGCVDMQAGVVCRQQAGVVCRQQAGGCGV